jgi:hypothetical protein
MSVAQSGVGTKKTKKRSRVWLAVVGILLVLAIVGGVAYFGLTGFFNANGTWYGPMQIKKGGATVQIETYMNVSTSIASGCVVCLPNRLLPSISFGTVSGSGTFCVPLPFNNTGTFDYTLTGDHAFMLPGREYSKPLTLTAEYTVPVVFGITVPIGPSLTLHGDAMNDALKLTGGDSNTSATLTMKHGSKADFTAACKQLKPLG